MPLCFLHTNLKESALEDGIELRIARTIGQILGKPLEVCVCCGLAPRNLRVYSTFIPLLCLMLTGIQHTHLP
uniref:Uncharacterized protein n=1 Tax=Arion vulgaris TaxID=1028688 RepID=A0A0B6ZUM1_9EUPU